MAEHELTALTSEEAERSPQPTSSPATQSPEKSYEKFTLLRNWRRIGVVESGVTFRIACFLVAVVPLLVILIALYRVFHWVTAYEDSKGGFNQPEHTDIF